ncbi:MAG: acyl-CoA thioesterase [Akkermansia sp.]|nr:acyl-CoA thioesterase [Akkermansia sp.]
MPTFTYKRRIAFHETDAAGVVYFANFFRLAEEAETHALASLGSIVTRDGYLYPRVHAEADYLAPLRFFDEVAVHCCITRIGSSSAHWKFEIVGPKGLCAVVQTISSRRERDGSAAPYTPEERAAYSALIL